jgi:hypothetical protein
VERVQVRASRYYLVRYLIVGLHCDNDEKPGQGKGNNRVEHDAPSVFPEKFDLEEFVPAFDQVQFLFKFTRWALRFGHPEEPPDSGDAPLQRGNTQFPI